VTTDPFVHPVHRLEEAPLMTTPPDPHRLLAVARDLPILLATLLTTRARDDRGDVPGWVMITVMTAGLVAALTAVAGPQLRDMLVSALNSVGG
jgi:ABC-type phosphate/phosphonate transport system permease subunit